MYTSFHKKIYEINNTTSKISCLGQECLSRGVSRIIVIRYYFELLRDTVFEIAADERHARDRERW